MLCLFHALDLGKVHQRVGRLIKVYVACLGILPLCVVMLSAEVSEEKNGGEGGEGNAEKRKAVEGYVWNVRFPLLIN